MERKLDIIINPTENKYCFTFSDRDCYKLASGRCTFELSDEEFKLDSAKCLLPFYYGGRVGYCRELYQSMLESDGFTHPTGIRAYKNSCGHIVFLDGQHRTCIAKKKQLEAIMFDYLGNNHKRLCKSCYMEQKEASRKKVFKITKQHDFSKDGPIDITDDKL